jgi:hypothetical protein
VSDLNMPEKLWDLANLITGFGVLQSLAMTFALTKSDEFKLLSGAAAHWCTLGGTVFFTALYIGAIIWCNNIGAPLDRANDLHIWNFTTIGRVTIVALFTIVMCAALFGHWRRESATMAA